MGEKNDKLEKPQDDWTRPSVSKLEADIAYFDARLCMLDDWPSSCYRNAEKKAYQTLEISLNETLDRLRNGQKRRRKKAAETEEPFSEFLQEIEPPSAPPDDFGVPLEWPSELLATGPSKSGSKDDSS